MEACFPCLDVRKRRVAPRPFEATPRDPRLRHVVAAAARTFSFEELAAATRNFRDDCLVAAKESELYKGYLMSVNKLRFHLVVAIKLQHAVDGRGSSEKYNIEFLAHVLKLSALRHPNLVNLIGFCADGNHRILVQEYMPLGSLEDHLHDPSPDKARLDWNNRMNIAAGVAKGLEYMHDKGVAYRCMRSSDILIGDGDGYHPKLSQYGLAELGQLLYEPYEHVTKQYYGYSAPEIGLDGKLTAASSVYSFGVVLLEMITGRRGFATQAAEMEHPNIVVWARPLWKSRARLRRMADPALQGRYPPMDLVRALAVAYVCVQQDPAMRPPIEYVVKVMALLAHDQPS